MRYQPHFLPHLGNSRPKSRCVLPLLARPGSFAAIALGALSLSGCGGGSSSSSSSTTLESRIAFVSNRDGNLEIYSMKPDGTDVKRLTNSASVDTQPCWSWDRKRIAFVSNRSGSFQIWTMNRDGSSLTQWTNLDLDTYINPSFGPDGRIVAQRANSLIVLDAPNATPHRITSTTLTYANVKPFWERNNKIFYTDGVFGAKRAEDVLVMQNPDGSDDRELIKGPHMSHPSLTPDGTVIGVTFDIYDGRDSGFYILPFPITTLESRDRIGEYESDFRSPSGGIFGPEGRQVVRADENDTYSEITVTNITTKQIQRLTDNKIYDGQPSWR